MEGGGYRVEGNIDRRRQA